MDIGLAKLLLMLFPGVAAYVVSERMISRMGRGRSQSWKATMGVLCFAAWSLAVYALVNVATRQNLTSNLTTHLKGAPALATGALTELVPYISDFVLLTVIAVVIAVLYSWCKNRDVDKAILSRIGIKHTDRGEVWDDFRRCYERDDSPGWVRVEFDDGAYAICSIESMAVSRDIDSMILFDQVTMYRGSNGAQRPVEDETNEGEEFKYLLMDYEKSNVSRILVCHVIKSREEVDNGCET